MLRRRGLEPRLSVRAGLPTRLHPQLASRITELTGMKLGCAYEALRGRQLVLSSVPPAQAMAAAVEIQRLGGLVKIELGLIERYAFVSEHPSRGTQTCERLAIHEGDLILTEGLLAGPFESRMLLRGAYVSQLLAGFDGERARWAAAGMVEVADELELLQRVSAREPRLEAALCEAEGEAFHEAAAVYGDWLQNHGEPRGLVATVSLGGAASDEPAVREQAERMLAHIVDDHASRRLGGRSCSTSGCPRCAGSSPSSPTRRTWSRASRASTRLHSSTSRSSSSLPPVGSPSMAR